MCGFALVAPAARAVSAHGVDLVTHPTYLNRYQDAAASFVLSKIGG